MKILIIEDEQVSAEELKRLLLDTYSTYQVDGIVDTIESAVSYLNSKIPDLIFMDIELADGSAFEIFKHIDITCPVIFTTAYDQFAIKAFEHNGIDYLLKPITATKLVKSLIGLEKKKSMIFRSSHFENILKTEKVFKESFLLKFGKSLIPVPTSEIKYFKGEGNVVYVQDREKRNYLSSDNLGQLESMLNPNDFFRLNRQFIVNKKAIKSLMPHTKGQVIVIIDSDKELEVVVSRQKTPILKEWLS